MKLKLVVNPEPGAVLKNILQSIVDIYPAVVSEDHAHLVELGHLNAKINRVKEYTRNEEYTDAQEMERILQSYKRLISKANKPDPARKGAIRILRTYIIPLCRKYSVEFPH